PRGRRRDPGARGDLLRRLRGLFPRPGRPRMGDRPQPRLRAAGRRQRRDRRGPSDIALAGQLRCERGISRSAGQPDELEFGESFAGQVEGLTSRYARRAPPLDASLGAVAAALAGRAGSRLAAALRMTAGRTCMLRLLMALPAARPGTVRVLGDDFAFRRGRLYGTILIDIEADRPVHLLPDRTAHHPLPWQQRLPRIDRVPQTHHDRFSRTCPVTHLTCANTSPV